MGGANRRDGSPRSAGSGATLLRSGLAAASPSLVAGVLFFVGIVAAVVYGWRTWGRSVIARPIYRLATENIEITPPPPWIRTDLRAEVVRDNALSDLTVFDKDATIRVFQAFELHPWVAKVKRVSKHPPARLSVDLDYREPVAWVEVPDTRPGDDCGVIPVDSFGFVLPTRDFGKEFLGDYLRISIRQVRPYGLAGTAWGDPRVLAAAKIATSLKEIWRPLQLYRIQIQAASQEANQRGEPIYELETRSFHRITWGHAPGAEPPDEPSVPAKLQRLVRLAESLGSLERLPVQGTDLRDRDPLPAAHTASAGRSRN